MMQNAELVLLACLMVPGVALAEVNVGDVLGTKQADIRAALKTQGYTVAEFETEDDEIEVETELNSQAYEIELSAESGKVLEIEHNDDAEDS